MLSAMLASLEKKKTSSFLKSSGDAHTYINTHRKACLLNKTCSTYINTLRYVYIMHLGVKLFGTQERAL